MPWDQNPEQANENYSEDEQKGKQKWRDRGGEAGRKREQENEEENEKELEDEQEEKRKREHEKQYPKKRLVSKSLMATLWAKFKLNRCPTIQESLSLSFQFGMTHKQVCQWFCKNRKKCLRERIGKKRWGLSELPRLVSNSCPRGNLPTLASRSAVITSMSHYAWLRRSFFFLLLFFFFFWSLSPRLECGAVVWSQLVASTSQFQVVLLPHPLESNGDIIFTNKWSSERINKKL
uniref:NANOG neighbor homeobox-like n=1 Tax=Callithrix jacchus TaxID=9483 RepID=UPI0023DD46AE|nr:NANOG neighbor homeobox-like [Callithrix jacchus]